MDKTTVYFPREMRLALEEAARRNGTSQARLIRDAVAAYLEREERPWPRSIGMFSGTSVTSESIEEWLEANWTLD